MADRVEELAKVIHGANPYLLVRKGWNAELSRDKTWEELGEAERDSCLDQAQAALDHLKIDALMAAGDEMRMELGKLSCFVKGQEYRDVEATMDAWDAAWDAARKGVGDA